MKDMKTAAILVLLSLVVITGIGWLNTALGPAPGRVPYDNLFEWAQSFGGYEAYLDKRIHPATMAGTSMVPTLNAGDTILWVEVDDMGRLAENDIIIFKHPTLPGVDNVAHRIVEVTVEGGEYRFRTKADNMPGPDQHPVLEANVHGLVIGVIYSAGTG